MKMPRLLVRYRLWRNIVAELDHMPSPDPRPSRESRDAPEVEPTAREPHFSRDDCAETVVLTDARGGSVTLKCMKPVGHYGQHEVFTAEWGGVEVRWGEDVT